MTAKSKFQSTKAEILDLIQHSREVTKDTPRSTTGIYLLYVDDFSDDKVLPIYIGQTTDFKRRLKQHISDVSQLNALAYRTYHDEFLWRANDYSGQFKACKIFKYMVDHHCTFQNLHMVILEECPSDQLSEREQFYLSQYLPAFFGFNQINTITEQFRYPDSSSEEYRKIKLTDAELFHNYIGYGFSAFNYLHAFCNSPYNVHKNDLDKAVNKDYYSDLFRRQKIDVLTPFIETYYKAFESAYPAMHARFSAPIHEIFEQHKFKSKGREAEVLFLLLNNSNTSETRDVYDKKSYLEYYMNRDRKSRECGSALQALFEKHLDEIREINAPVMAAYKAYVDCRKDLFQRSRYSLIFPNVPYEDNPLEDPAISE